MDSRTSGAIKQPRTSLGGFGGGERFIIYFGKVLDFLEALVPFQHLERQLQEESADSDEMITEMTINEMLNVTEIFRCLVECSL